MILLQRWEEAYTKCVVLANDISAGAVINSTRDFLARMEESNGKEA